MKGNMYKIVEGNQKKVIVALVSFLIIGGFIAFGYSKGYLREPVVTKSSSNKSEIKLEANSNSGQNATTVSGDTSNKKTITISSVKVTEESGNGKAEFDYTNVVNRPVIEGDLLEMVVDGYGLLKKEDITVAFSNELFKEGKYTVEEIEGGLLKISGTVKKFPSDANISKPVSVTITSGSAQVEGNVSVSNVIYWNPSSAILLSGKAESDSGVQTIANQNVRPIKEGDHIKLSTSFNANIGKTFTTTVDKQLVTFQCTGRSLDKNQLQWNYVAEFDFVKESPSILKQSDILSIAGSIKWKNISDVENTIIIKNDSFIEPFMYYEKLNSNKAEFKSNNKEGSTIAILRDTVTMKIYTNHQVDLSRSSGEIAGQSADLVYSTDHYELSVALEEEKANEFQEFTCKNIPVVINLVDAANGTVKIDNDSISNITYYGPMDSSSVSIQYTGGTDSQVSGNAGMGTVVKSGEEVEFNLKSDYLLNKDIEVYANGVKLSATTKDGNGNEITLKAKVEGLIDNAAIAFQLKVKDIYGNGFEYTLDGGTFFDSLNSCISNAKVYVKGKESESESKEKIYVKDGDILGFEFESTHQLMNGLEVAFGATKVGLSVQEVVSSSGITMYKYTAEYTVDGSTGQLQDNENILIETILKDLSSQERTLNNLPDSQNKKAISGADICYFGELNIMNISFIAGDGNNTYIKNGTQMKLTFQTNHPVEVSQGTNIETLENLQVSNVDGEIWEITYTLKDKDLSDDVGIHYTINIEDAAGNSYTTGESKTEYTYYQPISPKVELKVLRDNQEMDSEVIKNEETIVCNIRSTHPLLLSDMMLAGMNFKDSKVEESREEETNEKSNEKRKIYCYSFSYKIEDGDLKDLSNVLAAATLNDDAKNDTVKITQKNSNMKVKYYGPIQIQNITYHSSNVEDGDKYIKDGDTISLSFLSSHEVTVNSVNFGSISQLNNGSSQKFTNNSCAYKYGYTVKNGDYNDVSKVPYEITVTDIAGNTFTTTNYRNGVQLLEYYAPITGTFSLSTDGNGSTYAKNGSTLKVTAKANHKVSIDSGMIQGRSITSGEENNTTVSMYYKIPNKESVLSEGYISYLCQLKDVAGNLFKNQEDSKSIVYDRTVPSVAILPNFSGFTNATIAYTVSYEDSNLEASSLDFSINGEGQISGSEKSSLHGTKYTKSVVLDLENEYTITATSKDKAGNASDPDLVSKIVIDKTNPKITTTKIDISTPKTYQAGFLISKYFNIEEKNVKEIICKITDQEGTYDWDIEEPIVDDGKKTIYLMVTDMAGNHSTELTYDLYIDGSAPVPVIEEVNTEKTLTAIEEENKFYGTADFQISLKNMLLGDEEEDTFTKLQVVDSDGKVVSDLLKESEVNEEGEILCSIGEYGEYRLLAEAEDSVGNKTKELEYPFTLSKTGVMGEIFQGDTTKKVVTGAKIIGIATTGIGVVLISGTVIIRKKRKALKEKK